ncbi:hypothetical protein ABZ924_10515 [Streptomyces sp. NPDC046876]|uniref:hypothetical protein n=1 Tax=Streptomyces sp. NPDC046876 TaxID=3155616 RepID=UPI0033BFE41E
MANGPDGPEVEVSAAHPGGICSRAHVPCGGCGLPAPIAVRYGGPMADCRLCCYAWAVRHDPSRCWQPSGGYEPLTAAVVERLAPVLLAARARLDGILGGLCGYEAVSRGLSWWWSQALYGGVRRAASR